MRNKLWAFGFGVLASIFFASTAFADATVKYYEITFAPYSAATPGIQFPVFVYQQASNGGWKQIGYVADETKNIFVGPVAITSNNPPTETFKVVTAQLNSTANAVQTWTSGCQFSVQGNTITTNTCVTSAGAPIVTLTTTDSQSGANFYTLGFGSNEPLPAITPNDYPTAYHLPLYVNPRTVTIYNNTSYPVIQVSYASGPGVIPAAQPLILQGQSLPFSFPAQTAAGSLAWIVTGYGTTATCQPGDTSCWVTLGGYSSGGITGLGAYATKIEGSYPGAAINNYGVLSMSNANIDLSAVDGFTFKTILTPNAPAYCTKNPPSQWSQPNSVPFVGDFSPQNFMAVLPQIDNGAYPSQQDLCTSLSGMALSGKQSTYTPNSNPSGLSGINGLAVSDTNGSFLGCMSPCAYATLMVANNNTNFINTFSTDNGKNNGKDIVDNFCCPASAGFTKKSCDAAGYINTSSYVKTLDGVNADGASTNPANAKFKNTYSYTYDDPNANMGCPGDTSYNAYVFNGSAAPSISYLTPVDGIQVTSTNAGATFVWDAPMDSATNPVITYTATVLQNGVAITNGTCTSTSPATTCNVSNLVKNTPYQVQISATDGTNTSQSKIYNFSTQGGTAPETMTVSAPTVTQNGQMNTINLNWSAAQDPTPNHTPITYTVTAKLDGNIAATQSNISGTSTSLTDLIPGFSYVVTVTAQDTVSYNGYMVPNSGSANTSYRLISPPYNVSVPNVAATSAEVTWLPGTHASDVTLIAQATSTSGATISSPSVPGTSKNTTITGLHKNTPYNLVIQATDGSNYVNSAQISFTTPGSNKRDKMTMPLITQPIIAGQTTAPVSWSAATDTLNKPVSYEVLASPVSTGSMPTPIQTSNTSTTLTGLIPNTAYTVTVIASDGTASRASVPASFKTEASPLVIGQPTAMLLGTSTVQIYWYNGTSDTDPNAGSIAYTVTATSSTGGKTVARTVHDVTNTTLKGLSAGATYTVVVTGQDSDPVAPNTATSQQSASFRIPTPHFRIYDVTATGVDHGGAQVNWAHTNTYPAHGTIHYTVSALSQNGGAPKTAKDITGNTVTLHGLTHGKTYQVIVFGEDHHKHRAKSLPSASFTPGYTLTIAQPIVPLAHVGDTKAVVDVSYNYYTYDGPASPSFTITGTSKDGGAQVGPKPIPYGSTYVTGFTPGATYTVVVNGKDQYGNTAVSIPSVPFTMTKYTLLPATGVNVPLSGVGYTDATVNWTAASDSDTNATINYTVNVSTSQDGSNPNKVVVPSGSCNASLQCSYEVNGLNPNTPYYVVVEATDNHGNDKTSSPEVPFTTASYVFTIPQPAVTGMTQTTANIDTGLPNDTYPNQTSAPTFTVTGISTNGGAQVGPESIPVGTTQVTGFTPGATYNVTVNGVDSLGNKATSPQSAQFTMLPYTVTQPVVGTMSPGTDPTTQEVINWSASNDQPTNSSQVITYAVTATPVSGGTPVVNNGLTTTQDNMQGLVPNTTYNVSVTATDQAGNTSTSPTPNPTFTTQQAATPLSVMYDSSGRTSTSARVYWNRVPGETCSDNVVATATPANGAPIVGQVICGREQEVFAKFNGLSSSQSYNAVVELTVNGQLYKGSAEIPAW